MRGIAKDVPIAQDQALTGSELRIRIDCQERVTVTIRLLHFDARVLSA